MRIQAIVWLPDIIEKLDVKHSVSVEEVEEVFELSPHIRKGPVGDRLGEDLYKAYGQTSAGRYLFVVFIYKQNHRALILSARDMTERERRLYQKVKK
jgi:uncharacterized DUF497 family protein